MATTQSTYTGNGTTVLFSFTFPYIETTDIKVSVNGTITTAYTLANATTIQFTTAPANGSAVRIYRQTDDTGLQANFYPGSAIRAQDLNDNFTQNLYVTQEANNVAASATTVSNSALAASAAATSTANTALSNSTAAVSTANTASSNASAAVSTANTASTNASTAVTTANTANTKGDTAIASATAANTTAASAVSTANAATSTANSAASQAAAAVTTANTASSNASAAVTTANTASTNATTAVNTANGAVSTANSASSTATSANSKADQAISAVSNSINYQLKTNVAAIPATPANDTYIEVQDSTGLESFTPLAGKPAGFVGDSGLSVRLRYTSAGTTWNWLNYYPNNSETRYLKLAGGTLTGNITLAGAPSSNLHPATKAYVDGYVGSINGDIASLSSTKLNSSTAASTYAPLASPVFTGTPTVPGYLTTASASSTYQTQAGMSSYLTTTSASSTYLPTATAASTYQTQAGMSSYLTTATAGTTYQTQAGMSSYLTTTAAGSTYQPLSGMSSYAALGTAQSFTKAQRGTPVALTDAATVAVDLSLSNHYTLSLGGNRTLGAPTNQTAGQSGVIVLSQDATGSRTLAFASVWKFPGGTAPTLTTTANAVDVLAYYVESSTRITARLVSDVK